MWNSCCIAQDEGEENEKKNALAIELRLSCTNPLIWDIGKGHGNESEKGDQDMLI